MIERDAQQKLFDMLLEVIELPPTSVPRIVTVRGPVVDELLGEGEPRFLGLRDVVIDEACPCRHCSKVFTDSARLREALLDG